MYLSDVVVRNFRIFGEGATEFHLHFQPGVTALVGRNDAGKSAIIDAIRYALLTKDQEYIRVEQEDFHVDSNGNQASEIFIGCKFSDLSNEEKSAFVEFLSYDNDDVILYVAWTARRLSDLPATRRWVDVSVRSGVGGVGPPFETSVRALLSTAYLRPLRDAEREMSSGRRSRLSQILANVPEITDGAPFDEKDVPPDVATVEKLGLVGLAEYMRHDIRRHSGVMNSERAINDQYLGLLSLQGDLLRGKIGVTGGGTEDARLRQILELLELFLVRDATGRTRGRYGLGSNNLLFIACELLLLGRSSEGLPLLLIEEPEAHLHPQRQIRLMDFLFRASHGKIDGTDNEVQIVVSTHSPNLASKIPVPNLVLVEGGKAFPFADGETKLERSDYRFLERFLDVTKANLFFAHGVIIVEGDAEAILLPAIAKLIGRDLSEYGVSIVNVGGRGLRRYSRVFQRSNTTTGTIGVRIACIADLDVMPDCAPEILGLVEDASDDRWMDSRRRWKALRDLGADDGERDRALRERRCKLGEDDGQMVRTFVSDHWTLEYDLARCGLAEQVYVAACLAKNDDPLNDGRKKRKHVVEEAKVDFATLRLQHHPDELCVMIYRMFASGSASKAVAAQYVAEILIDDSSRLEVLGDSVRERLPTYLIDAIDYVTIG